MSQTELLRHPQRSARLASARKNRLAALSPKFLPALTHGAS